MDLSVMCYIEVATELSKPTQRRYLRTSNRSLSVRDFEIVV